MKNGCELKTMPCVFLFGCLESSTVRGLLKAKPNCDIQNLKVHLLFPKENSALDLKFQPQSRNFKAETENSPTVEPALRMSKFGFLSVGTVRRVPSIRFKYSPYGFNLHPENNM